jgi:cytochrome P450
MRGRRIHYIDSLHRIYGPYARISPTEVAVNDPAGFKQIHSVTSGFEKSLWYQKLVLFKRPTLFGMTDNKTHGLRRRMLARGFSKSNMRQNWEAVVRDNIDLAVSQMRKECIEKGTCDMFKWWTFMATDTSAHVMFGESFDTLQRGEVNDYIRVMQSALMGGGIGAELPWVRSIGARLPFPAAWRLFGASKYLLDYGKIAVKNMKATQGAQNVFANIMAEMDKGERLDETDVVLEATALIVAGTDTTATTLTYLVWAVLCRPELQTALVQEVQRLPTTFKDSDLEELPLLNAVIEETLRLYGAAPGGLPRMVPKGGVELGGYWMAEGTTVTTQSYSLHRDPDNFYSPYE